MIARWCISILIFGLTLFGVVSQQQITVPNQEIVLQFEDVNLTPNQTENAVAAIKYQLQGLGAENIKVLTLQEGKLKITYFSDADIASIKQLFLDQETLALQLTSQSQDKDSSKLPFQESNISYDINIYEIQNGQHSGWDFDGAISLDVEVKSDRFIDPNYVSTGSVDHDYTNTLTHVTYKIRKAITIQISDPLHKIPEVRAGPLA
ncbi:hypothetical protein DIS18_01930 [Algibacter marinivivus]|uniref:Uncharacterized protein n=1 Tax=Algibacter marinivivus TaxID=2100723 RepID=A0A2U2X6C2_9FLAO|nr:hypothetical protein [Algibacter marinivivus]PWH83336.1 hypothetical protein DIS18_01930 [Algibacter marinivivus]